MDRGMAAKDRMTRPRRAMHARCPRRRSRRPWTAAACSQHYPQVGEPISIPTRSRRRRVAQASSLWGQRASRLLGRGLSSGDWPAEGTPGRMPGVPTGWKPVLLVRDATPSGNPPRRLVGNAQSLLPLCGGRSLLRAGGESEREPWLENVRLRMSSGAAAYPETAAPDHAPNTRLFSVIPASSSNRRSASTGA